jgi:hypothetical protein
MEDAPKTEDNKVDVSEIISRRSGDPDIRRLAAYVSTLETQVVEAKEAGYRSGLAEAASITDSFISDTKINGDEVRLLLVVSAAIRRRLKGKDGQ